MATAAHAEPQAYQFNSGSGQWTLTQSPRPTAPVAPADPALDRLQQLFDGRDYGRVHDELLAWLKANPKAADRDRAILLMAEVYYVQGDLTTSFYQCDELLENFPDSRLFFPTLDLQYHVADAFLSGYKEKFLGMAIVPMEDTAIDMLFRLQERAPGSPIAERSLQRTADYYYASREYGLAADAYGAFIRIYPRSPNTPRARLRQAYSNFAQFHGPKFDVTPLLDARTEFQDIQVRSPEFARAENLQRYIDRIDVLLAQKILIDGDYFNRVNQPKSAVFEYRELIQRYPSSPEAATARNTMARMPAWTKADPPPPAFAGQGPPVTTRPIEP